MTIIEKRDSLDGLSVSHNGENIEPISQCSWSACIKRGTVSRTTSRSTAVGYATRSRQSISLLAGSGARPHNFGHRSVNFSKLKDRGSRCRQRTSRNTSPLTRMLRALDSEDSEGATTDAAVLLQRSWADARIRVLASFRINQPVELPSYSALP